ncbi:ABC transporter substrate-binding protein [Haloferax sp. Atlit-48N]|uniref:ABC transporter substrate-binding protein n=1 Tax=Haloferax sp. Atlit-48N TaxID=2077198 RepID=A0ACD5I3P5_9EURY|nr:ABC transporter substrate-binding protein [Haloferax sp. Atlit-48N]
MPQYTRRGFLEAGLGTAAIGSIAGCSSNADQTTIVIGGSYIPESIDPVTHSGGPLGRIGVYESLFRVTRDVGIEPQLADEWHVSPDGTTWTIGIRDGVQFHDGTSLMSEAVAFSLSRAFDEASLLSPLPVESISATDTHEVVITTGERFAPLPSYLAHRYATVISQSSISDSDGFVEPVGTGPYMFDSWESGKSITATKNSDYYGSSPQVDRVVYEGIRDNQTKVSSLDAGESDIVVNLPVSAMERISRAEDTRTQTTRTPQSRFLAYNVREPPFDDLRVRQAVNHAIDTQTIARTILEGIGDPAIGPFSPELTGWANDELEPYEYSPDRARSLLAEAGWTLEADGDELRHRDGTPFDVVLRTYTRRPELRIIATAIQNQLRAVGINVEINITEWSALSEDMQAGETDFSLLSFNFFWVPDPDRAMSFYHSEDTQIYTGYEDSEVDDLIERGRRTTDDDERKRIYDRVQEIVHDDTPLGMLTYSETVTGIRNRIEDFTLHPTMYSHGVQNIRLH